MDSYFILAQGFGFIAFLLAVISVVQNSRGKYIVFNCLQCGFSSIQYLLLDKQMAFLLSFVSVIRLIVYGFKNKFSKSVSIIILILFVSLNLGLSILSFGHISDIIPLIASTILCFSVWQNTLVIIRYGLILAKILWGVYAVFSMAYFAILMDLFLVIWTIIVIIRENNKKIKH